MFYYYYLFWLHVSDYVVHHQANHKTLKRVTVTIFKYIMQFFHCSSLFQYLEACCMHGENAKSIRNFAGKPK
jgi:hypothetical protein